MKKEKAFCEVCELISPAPTTHKEATVKEVIEMLRKKSKLYESIDYIYVTEKNGELIGVFSIKELFKSHPNTPIKKFMLTNVISISPKTPSENAAHTALKHGIKAMPVVESKILMGVIPPRRISKILNDSLRRDIFHFAGIHKSHLQYENTLIVPTGKSIIHRIPWLLIGLIGIILTAGFINIFEGILEKHLILAFFIPCIVYISSALGTQIQTLYIRDLVVMGEDLRVHKYLLKQMGISISMAVIISAIMFIIVSIFWNQAYIAFVISLAALTALIITSLTAFIITYSIKKSGGDPALGGGPLATVISDATSIIVYFLIATALL